MIEGQALSKVPELRRIRPCGPNLDEERRRKSFSSRGRQATSFTSSWEELGFLSNFDDHAFKYGNSLSVLSNLQGVCTKTYSFIVGQM